MTLGDVKTRRETPPAIRKIAKRIWDIALDSWDLNVELSEKGVITYQSAWEKEFIERVEAELQALLQEKEYDPG